MLPEALPFRLPTPRDVERLAFEAGATVEAVCQRAGVSSQTFRNWKYDRGSPSLDTVRRLLEAGAAMLKEASAAPAGPPRSPRKPPSKPRRGRPKAKAAPVALRRHARRSA